MKKFLGMLLSACLLCGMIAGCGDSGAQSARANLDEDAYSNAMDAMESTVSENATLAYSGYMLINNPENKDTKGYAPYVQAAFAQNGAMVRVSMYIDTQEYKEINISMMKDKDELKKEYEKWLEVLDLTSPYSFEAAIDTGSFDVGKYRVVVSSGDSFGGNMQIIDMTDKS